MPAVDPGLFMEALDTLIDLDADWVPEVPSSLYIRPTMIADQPSLGVASSTSYLFYIIIGPVGSYFKGGIKPLRLKAETEFVRSAPGGTGYAKTGGNYAAALLPIKQAQDEGFDNIIWLDAISRRTVEEMGAMNIAFVYDDHVLTAPLGDTILAGVTRDSVGSSATTSGSPGWSRRRSSRPSATDARERQAQGVLRLRDGGGGHAGGVDHAPRARGRHRRRPGGAGHPAPARDAVGDPHRHQRAAPRVDPPGAVVDLGVGPRAGAGLRAGRRSVIMPAP